MTALLALVIVLSWGSWIPLAQAAPGVPQRTRTLYATVGNLAFATVALLAGGGHLSFGWREFWLPLVGGLVWTAGNFSAFRASEKIGLARAAGSWTPLNIIVAFVWGALLFGELDQFGNHRLTLLVAALVVVLIGLLLIVRSQEAERTGAPVGTSFRSGVLWAGAAGVLWGSYFVPAQWARVPSQVGNFPLAIGIFLAGAALALPARERLRLPARVTALQLGAGVLFGVGNLALLSLVARVGTGAGFTIAQLGLLVNASIGIFVFKVPRPGSRAARVALVGILLVGVGGSVIGALR